MRAERCLAGQAMGQLLEAEEEEEEEDREGLIEVVCPKCTMVNDICSSLCEGEGCGASLADAELLGC